MQLVGSEQPSARGRLRGKVAIITGAGGNLGREICARFLQEGADIAMLGRNPAKLDALRASLSADLEVDESRALTLLCDGADPEQTRHAVQKIIEHFGKIDILINNAGSAGPRQRLEDLPLSRADLEVQSGTLTDTESALDALHNIFGISWNMVRAVTPHLRPGASIVNISTIFSRTNYFGRTAYVVPKAALNAWSRRLAYELGNVGVRVNTVLPGPIASERISSVFASMDILRKASSGTTAEEVFDMMTLSRSVSEAEPARTFPTVPDVANTIVRSEEHTSELQSH